MSLAEPSDIAADSPSTNTVRGPRADCSAHDTGERPAGATQTGLDVALCARDRGGATDASKGAPLCTSRGWISGKQGCPRCPVVPSRASLPFDTVLVMTTDPLSSDDLLKVLDDLDSSWLERKGGRRDLKHRDGFTGAERVAIIGGFNEHVHQLARAITQLHRNDLAFESFALVRSAFECAVTAQWVGHNPLAPSALATEYTRMRQVTKATMAKSATKVFAEGARGIVVDSPPPLGATLKDRARNFERLCGDFAPEGNDLYLLYRILSEPSHASFAILDHNVEVDPSTGDLTLLRQRGQGMPPGFLLWMSASSVIWSDMAMNYLERDKARRNELRAFAHKVNTVSELTMTPKAVFAADRAIAKAKSARKTRN